jgi:hypothetical protein
MAETPAEKRQRQAQADYETFKAQHPDETTTRPEEPLGGSYSPRVPYVQPRGHGRPADNATRPLYYSRDVVAPSRWPPGQRMQWQLDMIAAGLLDREDVTLGVWDASTQKAYQSVLENANLSGQTKEESLQAYNEGYQASLAAGFGPAGKQAPVIQLTNAGDLRESFRKSYQERVGKNPSEAALGAFVDRFHQLEAAGQKTYNDAAPGSTVEVGPAVDTVAGEQIKQTAGAEEAAYQTITRMNDFFQMLDSPVG